MNFKALLVATGFFITAFSSFGQTPDQCSITFDPSSSSARPSFNKHKQCCFEGYAESKALDPFLIKDCICSFEGTDISSCGLEVDYYINKAVSEQISSKAEKIYYNDCFCRQNEGKLLGNNKTKDACHYLGKLARKHKKYNYNCEQRLPDHTQCSQFSMMVLEKIKTNMGIDYCDQNVSHKDYCNDLVTGFLTSSKCSPESTQESCTQHVESSMSEDSCRFVDTFNVSSCTEGQTQSSCQGGITLETASPQLDAVDPIEAKTIDNGEDPAPTNPLENLAELASEDMTIPPFPGLGPSVEANDKQSGGNLSSSSAKNNSSYVPLIGKYPSVSSSSLRSSSQARASKVGVASPTPISVGGGPSARTPMDLPMRRPPPVGPLPGSDPPGQGGPPQGGPGGNPFGPMGGGPSGNLGGGPSIGGLGSGGGSTRRVGRRGVRRATKGSGSSYMSSQGGRGLQGGSSSAINRRVRQKIAANNKRNKNTNKNKGAVSNTQEINAAFQRGLIRVGGQSRPASSTDFLPLFYFPDVENAYEELRDQDQFLGGQGT